MKILVACEESQAVTKVLRELGHDAFSCDIQKCSGGHPEWHFNEDIFKIIKNNGGIVQSGGKVDRRKKWDMMIAHPPCTYLAVSGAKWYYHPDDSDLPTADRRPHPRFPNRAKDREQAIKFFMKLIKSPIEKIAVENPIGIMSSRFRKPDQIVQPYMFGDSASKSTCFWLKNLPKLEPTDMVDKGERVVFKSGKSQPKWYAEALIKAKTPQERQKLRSKTFMGMARAMAMQWTRG